MKATELRIGNLVKINNELLPETKNEIYKVYGLNAKLDLSFPDSSGVVSLNHTKSIRFYSQFDEFINPISLTEEWLVKFGFDLVVKKGNQGEFRVYQLNEITYNTNHGWWWRHKLTVQPKYVHELQNLFFALTGEELTI